VNWHRAKTICTRLLVGLLAFVLGLQATYGATNFFAQAQAAYGEGNFAAAAQGFALLASNSPSAGVYQNLGNAEWQRGRVAEALLAWERALWLSPRDANARNNLQFAREIAQLESPDLTWGEITSTWLPGSWWAWLACGSLWFAVSLTVLPSVLRWRKSGWQQALVAIGLGVFLLSLPANFGALTRRATGFILQAETPLRLTPTAEGEAVTRLAAGEPARVVRSRGKYLLIRTRLTSGWVEREAFGFISPR
jgi:tetratricopeptide (TPR) repeat protein